VLLKLQIRSYGVNVCETDAPVERKVPYTVVWAVNIQRHEIYACVKSGYREQFIVDFGLMIYVCNCDVSELSQKNKNDVLL
jgi:hypothetical protein